MVDSLSVVIPVYRSAGNLNLLVDELEKVLPALAAQYEIILVDDGSPDQSWEAIQALVQVNPRVRGFTLMRNYGQHNALLCGIRQAQYEIIVTMDDDLQNPPDQIHKLLDKLAEGYDVVYGTPQREQHGLWRDLASQVTKLILQGSMGVDIARSVSAFRAMRTQVRDAFIDYRSAYVSIDVLLTWGTTRFAAVQVQHDPRRYGTSNYTLRKLIRHALNMITGFSTLPLQLASLVGFALAVFGILVLVYVIGRALLFGIVVPGFAFLASIVAIFSGAQLFALGVIGEYVARIHFRTMDRPVYTVRAATDEHQDT
ncbi:MAG TPA: glycosyltransferase family 2 protein [Phototrophicaceae bacterium]|nr:glycosyltransferase family 2 protein [Phototrophicaceae bacterium]